MDKLFGIYKGIVIENSGYQRDGTYIPGTVLVKIDGITPRTFVERYKGLPSQNVQGSLDKQTALTTEIPAYIMTPIIGESSMGKYNASSNKSSISDVTTDPAGFGGSKIELKPPSAQFKIMNDKGRDKFSDGPDKHTTIINNSNGNSFFPDHRYKAGKGVFAVPEVNSRVIVQFCNGSRSLPIIVGKINTPDEIEGYYDVSGTRPTYPNTFQNNSNPNAPSGSNSTDSSVSSNNDDNAVYLNSLGDEDIGGAFYNSPTNIGPIDYSQPRSGYLNSLSDEDISGVF